ncbi:MAG: DUF262 domain-containing protein [Bacteroidales bacterium]|nr:DUF262 domain-containing protein [Bacteroidales bacterium]
MKNLISLKEYLDKEKTFIIPNYQRGYIWGRNNKSDKNSVEFILETIKNGFYNKLKVFLQGITASETETNIELIDGQQRTTFFYLLLCYLEYEKKINLIYSIRKESEAFLNDLHKKDRSTIVTMSLENEEELYQDVFFFKKTLRHIHSELKHIDKELLKLYILNDIKFLYINIPKEKAIKTFSMMNGNKAVMLPEELIKAEMLRQISLNSEIEYEDFSKKWETNALRSRYAREWDKWLRWWNKSDVRYFFKVKNPMGLLLEYYYFKLGRDKNFNFPRFKALLSTKREAQIHFKGLRNLQKSFEDIYNDPIIYNLLGVSLKDSGDDKLKIILFFIENKHNLEELYEFTKWRVVGVTYDQIKNNDEEENEKEYKALEAFNALNQKFVYNSEGNKFVRKYLLYLNVIEDNKTNNGNGRKFNFHIFDKQSLEHIHPKSKVFHKDGALYKDGNETIIGDKKPLGSEWLNRDECTENISEHSIGNLVLLEGTNNSAFGNKTFNEKKNIYFDLKTNFKSRELLHTISVFAKEKWGKEEIEENQYNIISQFQKNYKIKATLKNTQQ